MSTLPEREKIRIKRRSSSHSAYWMSNALVPAGLILMYRNGWSIESIIGLIFVAIGAIGFAIYKQKMSVPLICHDGSSLCYNPSASKPCTIEMDSSARFTVHELGLSAEKIGDSESRFEVSRLEFNSNADWDMFVQHLEQQPQINVRIDG